MYIFPLIETIYMMLIQLLISLTSKYVKMEHVDPSNWCEKTHIIKLSSWLLEGKFVFIPKLTSVGDFSRW